MHYVTRAQNRCFSLEWFIAREKRGWEKNEFGRYHAHVLCTLREKSYKNSSSANRIIQVSYSMVYVGKTNFYDEKVGKLLNL